MKKTKWVLWLSLFWVSATQAGLQEEYDLDPDQYPLTTQHFPRLLAHPSLKIFDELFNQAQQAKIDLSKEEMITLESEGPLKDKIQQKARQKERRHSLKYSVFKDFPQTLVKFLSDVEAFPSQFTFPSLPTNYLEERKILSDSFLREISIYNQPLDYWQHGVKSEEEIKFRTNLCTFFVKQAEIFYLKGAKHYAVGEETPQELQLFLLALQEREYSKAKREIAEKVMGKEGFAPIFLEVARQIQKEAMQRENGASDRDRTGDL